jgi:uncharacterized membrane protein
MQSEQRSGQAWRNEIPQIVLILGMWIVGAAAWHFAPDRLPVHWNLAGEVDRYGGKVEGLLLLPLLATGLYLLLLLLPRIDPGRANYATFAHAYTLIRLSITAMLAFVYACILLASFGYHVDMGLLIPLAIGMLLCILGNVMGKIRPNWFVGVRTPWTLSSRDSWNKTHRLAGRLFVVLGCAFAVYGFLQNAWMLTVLIALGVASLSWVVVYSYLVWRHDPDRLSPAGTSPYRD